MKSFNILLLLSFICSCTSIEEANKKAAEKEESARIAQHRAYELGQQPGTPENMEAVNRDNRDAARFRREADEIREFDSWLLIFFEILREEDE